MTDYDSMTNEDLIRCGSSASLDMDREDMIALAEELIKRIIDLE